MTDAADPLIFGVLFTAGLTAALLAFLVWRSRSDTFPSGAVTLVLAASSEVLLAYSFSFSSVLSFEQQVLAIRATYVGWLVAPIAFFVFRTLTFRGRTGPRRA